MLQCATCSNVTVWTRVCMAPMTQFPHLAVKLADQGTQSHGMGQLHTAVQQPRPGTASINTWLTWHTLSSAGRRSGYCCRVLAADDYHQLSLSYPTDSTGHNISSSVTSFCRMPVFSLWFADCKQTQQDGQITEHASLAQSELRWTTGSAVEWLDCRL